MYYTGKNPLAKIGYKAKTSSYRRATSSVVCIKRCCVADPANWPLIRQALWEADGQKSI
ncbi:hypothetical protein OIU92_20910 [Escherichia coli]|nr:hypothetical protein [Escherichia coli]